MMKNSNKSQMLKLSLIAALLVVAPLLSSSLRGTYLYFIFNLLIIALGVEAGLLSSSSSSSSNATFDYDKKTSTTVLVVEVPQKPTEIVKRHGLVLKPTSTADDKAMSNCPDQLFFIPQKKEKVVDKCSSAKVFRSVVKVHQIKKCPSTPSIFFIGGAETEPEELELSYKNDHFNELEEFDEVVPSGQELYNKAETFIGNFYKQLKMQREESWQKINGLYKAL
ncbi:putative LIM and calponin domains-containing protein 1 [Heracleum sosnowskyi]|uniref:LIM and calponin domains-containing protein 1 n=1 Tax=Heracleum sosnowskyi TaxID=360622 RepID=A0AAD8IXG1_9APIA|nr:putative LIM and calponin domains-containing protein 1 [Heracleum sosnowskyi]